MELWIWSWSCCESELAASDGFLPRFFCTIVGSFCHICRFENLEQPDPVVLVSIFYGALSVFFVWAPLNSERFKEAMMERIWNVRCFGATFAERIKCVGVINGPRSRRHNNPFTLTNSLLSYESRTATPLANIPINGLKQPYLASS